MTNKNIANTIIGSIAVTIIFALLKITEGPLLGILGLVTYVAWLMAIIKLYKNNKKDWLIYVFSLSLIIYFLIFFYPDILYLLIPAYFFSIWSAFRLYKIQNNKIKNIDTLDKQIKVGFCHNCGKPIENDAKFCQKCGTKVL